MAMVRKQIYLTQDLDDKVKQLAKARNVPEAEIIRAALEQYGEYRVSPDAGQAVVRETATLSYGAGTMNAESTESLIRRVLDRIDKANGRRFLDIAEKRAKEVGESDGKGRGWTREDLYDERPKYLSR